MIEPFLSRSARVRGLLIGTAVGDALGLPMEGIGPLRLKRLFPGPPRHRLVGPWGMVSDDTDHALMTAQALLAHPDDVKAFARSLAGKLKVWLLGLPAGIGMATLRSTGRLWLGFSPEKSGVHSAGNGPAMRAPVIGAAFADDPERLEAFVLASTRMTHRHERADTAALAVAHAAAAAVQGSVAPEAFLTRLEALSPDDTEWQRHVRQMQIAWEAQESVMDLAVRLGLQRGVTGYSYHTVPIALYAWLRHLGDFAGTLEAVIAQGGDTDSVAAIAGALAGATVGEAGIPADWQTGIWDWPRGPAVWTEIADRLATRSTAGPVAYRWPALFPRNLLFGAVVLLHGFRRLAPPY